ncbi:M4 family metallopeptidase [Legionella sp. PATHC032]|uniref:M4 family metallopeptidase n=1 Tax=Legionella sp. PATHC032 TaxID=2992039 RepID=UPI001AFFF2EE|nr:M4 family metallopeptidase [Legionella sp. PATHC032]MCW8421538.1 M4 family metallopeptidase [Legionella sp. PATHC032]HAZ7572524.1 M4 family peptidase [Legionella pneumophila]HBA1633878.1 M4 family peptidase [Legionella pneumophila]
MKTRIVSFLVVSMANVNLQAASENLIWEASDNNLKKYNVSILHDKKGFISITQKMTSLNYQLSPVDHEGNHDSNDIRYQIYYRNIPVWGHELILHKASKSKAFLTGVDVSEIEKEIHQTDGKFSASDIESQIIKHNNNSIIYKDIKKIIYLDSHKKAHLAYHLSMYTNDPLHFVSAPNYIVDANSGLILKGWDDLTHKKIGQGLGGNVFILPYRSGLFQHGDSMKDIPSLGKFEVTVKGKNCVVESPEVRVINAAHTDLDKRSFPVLSIVEIYKNIPAFSYPCSKESQYININDGDTSPANYSFSAVNDAMYFAGVTLEMYKEYYGVEKPLGDDLPLRAYTHIKNFDNAFAVPSIKIKGLYLMHQQIVIGDGDTQLTAPAQSTLSHELSHNFTRLHSNLVYNGQSGGINEAFSDMASIAMQDYLRKDFPWYWDGDDWSIGREATISGEPIRYMDYPTKDGHSIDHFDDYHDDLDVHLTSGIFNKAFYLLAHEPNWSVKKAFQVMVDANIKYWTSGTSFEAAACGVIQAAIDRQYNKQDVINAFKEVGVVCPVIGLVN